MKKIILLAALVLAGCGDVEWFPEQTTTTETPATVQSQDVGTLVASLRVGPGNYTVTTTKGVFSTYTSMGAPYQTKVTFEQYTDPITKLQIGKVLRALQQTILVRDVLALVQ